VRQEALFCTLVQTVMPGSVSRLRSPCATAHVGDVRRYRSTRSQGYGPKVAMPDDRVGRAPRASHVPPRHVICRHVITGQKISRHPIDESGAGSVARGDCALPAPAVLCSLALAAHHSAQRWL
jgi:hypothetical protein